MKRLLLVLGPVLSIAGALGLVVFGQAFVSVFDEVLTDRVVNPAEPLPTSLGELRLAAGSGMALVLGLVVSCVTMVIRDGHQTTSLTGKILHVGAGFLLFIGSMPVLWGILVAKRGFLVIATSALAPKPEDVREMVEAASPGITLGCFVLLLGAAVMLVAGQVGARVRSPQNIGPRSVFGGLVATGGILLGLLAAFCFFGVWLHGSALETLIATPAKPSELAQQLTGILNKSLSAFSLVGGQAVLQALAGVFAPTSSSGHALDEPELET